MNNLMSKAHKLEVCFHCVSKEEKKAGTTKPLAMALLLVLLCGCAAPREFKAEAVVCGQVVKCEMRR
jgi:hypothetical protein